MYSRTGFGISLVLFSFAVAAFRVLEVEVPVLFHISLLSAALFTLCTVYHGERVRLKPNPRHLTAFYLCIAGGGAVGSMLTNFFAPLVSSGCFELHIGLLACAALFCASMLRDGDSRFFRGRKGLRTAVGLLFPAVLAAVLAIGIFHHFEDSVASFRNFYGVLRVETETSNDNGKNMFLLVHGATTHGFQYTDSELRSVPTSYYAKQSGIGRLFLEHPGRKESRPFAVGAVGLGVGTVAAYGQPGDRFDFFEINPEVIHLARGKRGYFTYLDRSEADIRVLQGDGRLLIERTVRVESKGGLYDILILDAFSSDSIPVHLLTREAFDLYFEALRTDGVLAVHTSNRVLDVTAQVLKQAAHRGAPAAILIGGEDECSYASEWVVITENEAFISAMEAWRFFRQRDLLGRTDRISLWTDRYSNLFEILMSGFLPQKW